MLSDGFGTAGPAGEVGARGARFDRHRDSGDDDERERRPIANVSAWPLRRSANKVVICPLPAG